MEHEKINQEYLDLAKSLMADSGMVESVSVLELMKNGSDVYDVREAVAPFKNFVKWMYA